MKILILNGSPHKNGTTSELIRAFTEGAESSGHEVKTFWLQGMKIGGCLGCDYCKNRTTEIHPCVQKDEMQEIYGAFNECDVLVLATPVYFWSFSGQLKIAVDRLYAYVRWRLPELLKAKKTMLISTGNAEDYRDVLEWYAGFEKYCGMKNLGVVTGKNNTDGAKAAGEKLS